MSLTEKIIIPFIDNEMKPEFFDKDSGFIGCYTEDINRPHLCFHIFLLYEFTKGISLYHTFSKFKRFHSSNCIFINNVCFYEYIFCMGEDRIGMNIDENINYAIKGFISGSVESRVRLLNFWKGDEDIENRILCNNLKFSFEKKIVPEEDYRPPSQHSFSRNEEGLTLDKRESALFS